jgi:carbon storage regulator
MLVLSRTVEEAIMIGDNIVITVLEVKGDKVKIGISAPLNIPVHRKEIYLAIRQENIEAAGIDAGEVAKVIGLLAKKPKNIVKDGTK